MKFNMSHDNGRVLRLTAGFSLFGFFIPQFWSLVYSQWRLWAISLIPIQLMNLASIFQEHCDKLGKTASQQCNLPTDSLVICAFTMQALLMVYYGLRGNAILFNDAIRNGYKLHS